MALFKQASLLDRNAGAQGSRLTRTSLSSATKVDASSAGATRVIAVPPLGVAVSSGLPFEMALILNGSFVGGGPSNGNWTSLPLV